MTVPGNLFTRSLLVAWVVIWILFTARPYFKQGLASEYSRLLSLSLEGKRAYVTGDDLYGFIKFCGGSVGKPSTYKIVGLAEPLDERRVAYYLYPNVESDSPEFIFVYRIKDFTEKSYYPFKALDSERYILKKRG